MINMTSGLPTGTLVGKIEIEVPDEPPPPEDEPDPELQPPRPANRIRSPRDAALLVFMRSSSTALVKVN
jgi:hypothetical protein